MILLILFAFLSGLVIVLSPCVWPILPIIFSAGAGGKRRPLGMVTGLAISLSLFTLLFTSFLHLVPVEPETLRLVATGLIFLFGIILVIPQIGHWFESVLGRLIPVRNGLLEKQEGFKGGLLASGTIRHRLVTLCRSHTRDRRVTLCHTTTVVWAGARHALLCPWGRLTALWSSPF